MYDPGDLNEYLLLQMRCYWVTLLVMLRLIYLLSLVTLLAILKLFILSKPTTRYNKYNMFIIVGGVNLGDLNDLLAHLS